MNSSSKPSRLEALKQLVVLPALAGVLALTATSIADAADNKKQFKYQTKPGKNGQECSGCKLFKAPNACQVVTGTISPNGWCMIWAKR